MTRLAKGGSRLATLANLTNMVRTLSNVRSPGTDIKFSSSNGLFQFNERNRLQNFKIGISKYCCTYKSFSFSGSLKIIDRKKDLVKLQLGEYVSLGKVEAHLKTHPLVENICVYADPYKSSCVALVVPSRPHLEEFASKLGNTQSSYDQLCSNPEVINEVVDQLTTAGLGMGLKAFEIPKNITLCTEQWTPESGLITAAFKLKRKVVQGFYQQHITRMYERVG